MKLLHSFDRFLADCVNLNKTRVDQANNAFDTLTSFLENHDDVSDLFIDTFKQGSLRQGTIIKPRVEETEFDVDLLLRLTAIDDWSPRDYLDLIHAAFKSSDRYKEIVDRRGKHRCVTIDYATNNFHVDVVPSIEKDGQCWIMNRESNEFEVTDGDGYAAWFAGRNALTGGKQLIKVVRLVKYLRDEHEWPVKSILLTTLLGQQVLNGDTASLYSDVPTALQLLMKRLDDWLQSQTSIPTVSNPALEAEEFTRHWDENIFEEFRDGVHATAEQIQRAYSSAEAEESLDVWREAFGEEFPLDDDDLVEKSLALAVIPATGSISHARPISDIATSQQLAARVKLDGWVFNRSGSKRFRGINSNATVPSGRAIKFKAWTDAAPPYEVHWQVVNTGQHAAQENALRGTFLRGRNLKGEKTPPLINWEITEYTGRHWIECFIVKDGICIGRSKPFYVNIKNPSF